jgi:DNA-binding response OmpR family regulator
MEALSMRALIVDDDAAMSEIISRCLSRWGWTADASPRVPEALRRFERRQYDLAVCDVDLNGGDGILLAQTLLNIRPALRVVIVSGDPDNLSRARKSGLSMVLRKPFELNDLKAIVDAVRDDRPRAIDGRTNRPASRTH